MIDQLQWEINSFKDKNETVKATRVEKQSDREKNGRYQTYNKRQIVA